MKGTAYSRVDAGPDGRTLRRTGLLIGQRLGEHSHAEAGEKEPPRIQDEDRGQGADAAVFVCGFGAG